jgi:heat shock protein 4
MSWGCITQVIEKAATTEKWLSDLSAKQAERRKDQDPVVTSSEINKKREELVL